MATIAELHESTRAFLTRPPNDQPVTTTAEAAEPGLESLGAGGPLGMKFSVFMPGHQSQALALASRFMAIANERPGEEGLAAVLEAARQAAETQDVDLVKYALLVFITHHPEGRKLPIAPLAERSPEKVPPSSEAVAADGIEALGALGEEAKLDYFREDTAVNDHHGKWHVVYPAGGQPDPANPGGPNRTKDRQGELFWYMHQQMLARYDTERLSLDLPRVEPLADYASPIPEGYDANLQGFSNREPDSTFADLNPLGLAYRVADHETRRDRLVRDGRAGSLRDANGDPVPITPDLLGATIEANAGAVAPSPPNSFYGNHHNFGHVFAAWANPPGGGFPNGPGVMTSTETAMRDPVFYRWHRHIDDIFFVWQETLPANDFGDAPPVELGEHAILYALAAAVPGADQPGFDGAAFAEATFGGARFEEPSSSFDVATDELRTTVGEETIRLPNGNVVRKPYLDHEEYFCFLRLENVSSDPQKVTVRLFLAADEWADDRRMWIEMDKFVEELAPNQRKVAFRPGRQSSVVRKPARRPNEPRPQLPPGQQDRNYCDCGWPYHLLLPRGTEDGLPCRVFAMVTDFEQDLVGAEKKCGSMSFCGAQDAEYPDRRPMGYPFDRPFTNRDILETVDVQPNMTTRPVTIRHRPPGN